MLNGENVVTIYFTFALAEPMSLLTQVTVWGKNKKVHDLAFVSTDVG